MPRVVVYTRSWCSYCRRAKRLLDAKGLEYEERNIDADPRWEREMVERSGGRFTVPQIFLDGVHVGGSDELHALDARGELDRRLESRGENVGEHP